MPLSTTTTFLGVRQDINGRYVRRSKLTFTGLAVSATAWASATAQALGNQILASGNIQIVIAVTGDAKTGGTTPTWPGVGSTVQDNHVTWKNIGPSAQGVPHGCNDGNGAINNGAGNGMTPLSVIIEDTAVNSAAGLYESIPADATWIYLGIAGSITQGNVYLEY